jgi:hypothetical protein
MRLNCTLQQILPTRPKQIRRQGPPGLMEPAAFEHDAGSPGDPRPLPAPPSPAAYSMTDLWRNHRLIRYRDIDTAVAPCCQTLYISIRCFAFNPGRLYHSHVAASQAAANIQRRSLPPLWSPCTGSAETKNLREDLPSRTVRVSPRSTRW